MCVKMSDYVVLSPISYDSRWRICGATWYLVTAAGTESISFQVGQGIIDSYARARDSETCKSLGKSGGVGS